MSPAERASSLKRLSSRAVSGDLRFQFGPLPISAGASASILLGTYLRVLFEGSRSGRLKGTPKTTFWEIPLLRQA